ncbi:hypothetical protein HA402_006833 [Bradysia odoriphaga]|nr:hypothetical protein HA402_006833 [Bradysia odoriphaga]
MTKLAAIIFAFGFVQSLIQLTETVADQEFQRPNVIFILADDLGWNDVGFHGSAQIPTPNLDALAYSGLILNNYYVTPICTPSRSALMTGKYPIHTGMQHTVLYAAEPRGLSLDEKILPEYLKDLGYSNHIVGKWHLGHFRREYTPLFRGFDSHVGYWTGHHDYFDHTADEKPSWGLDIRRGLDVAYDLHGAYTTDIIARESVKIIQNHNASKPLFLYMAHAAVHSGNPYNPLPAPDESVAKMSHIDNYNRRKFAAMMSILDESVGAVVTALKKQNMLRNSIIIFSTDNGGPAEGFNLNAASNWPLRGVKNTLWEGGIRGAAMIWSPLIEKKSRISNQTMHITDWLPTIISAVGGDLSNLRPNIDGIDIWNALSTDGTSDRTEILHNIDDLYGNAAVTQGDWKVMKGTTYQGKWDGWYGPAGSRDIRDYDLRAVSDCPAGRALNDMRLLPNEAKIIEMRKNGIVNCSKGGFQNKRTDDCLPLLRPCLFNIAEDPCEMFNLAERYPNILNTMLQLLNRYNSTAVPPANLDLDPRGDPRKWGNVWTNFGDYE